ncbi:uncharacterized protein LOC125031627, partial [Penaeus chinensis]|uniref:uncharacterized protein LOC125031627 n=1 Tax=Penaeus chinensis TaxID=139456 RepID=UPI001FB70FD1
EREREREREKETKREREHNKRMIAKAESSHEIRQNISWHRARESHSSHSYRHAKGYEIMLMSVKNF